MNRETARQELRKAGRRILASLTTEARKGADGEPRYVCRLCQNGRDGNGDGITSRPSSDGADIICTRCGFSGDIIRYYMATVDYDYNGALEELTEYYLHDKIDGGELEGAEIPTNTDKAEETGEPDTAQNPPDLPVNHPERLEGTKAPQAPKDAPQPSERDHRGIDREAAKDRVRREVKCTDYLQKSQGGMFNCPFCGSGTKEHKTGAVKYYPETNTICCFGECGKKVMT